MVLITSCRQTTPVPAPPTLTATQPPTPIPTQTVTPTLSMPPSPTAMPPYPTASVVKSNAVAFIEREYWTGDLSLWIANVDSSGERKLVDIERNSDDWTSKRLLKWSPNGQWISYASGNDLWIISYDGSIKRNLLSLADKSMGNTLRTYMWTPDSSKVVFETNFFDRSVTPPPEGWPRPIVGIVDITTEKIKVLPIHDSLTSLTPDGNRILFIKRAFRTELSAEGIPFGVDESSFLLFDINTGKSVEIKPIDTSPWNACIATEYDNTHWSWSPNGQWFVYARHGNGPYYNRQLCVSNLDGTISYKIVLNDTHDIYAIPPVWDKTGNYLYLVARNFDDPLNAEINSDLRLVKFNIKTRKEERVLGLTDEPLPYDLFWYAAISPDKQTLELNKPNSGDSFSFIFLDIASLSTKKFTIDFISPPGTFFRINPIWSADSQSIIFLSEANNCFYKLDIQTGEITIISGRHLAESWAVSPIATPP